jgi:perosamine synthetase
MKINLFETVVEDLAIDNVKEVLQSTYLNEGEWVHQFELALTNRGLVNPLTTNSCTSALHLALEMSEARGKEVILPAQTFIATGQAVLMAGARPVFADIDPLTGNVNPTDIQRKITDKTAAIIAVHWGGLPAYMDQIYEVAGVIPVIEDAAHAFGAKDEYGVVGSLKNSDFCCFSFQSIKFLTTGDGGCICVRDKTANKEIKKAKWFGFDKDQMERRPEGDRGYMVRDLGFKYHMNNINAAIGLGNLDNIQSRIDLRQRNGNLYRCSLNNVPGVTLLNLPSKYQHAYWVFTMLVENRNGFIKKMKERKIQVSVLDRRIDEHPVFGGLTLNLLGQEKFDSEQISIPVHDQLTLDQIDYIVRAIKDGW